MMRESVIYQDILQQGLEQKAQEIATNMLNEGVAIALIVRVRSYEVPTQRKEFAQPLNVVILLKTNIKTNVRSHMILCLPL